jgi:predicted secreted hydrolase
MTRAGRLPVALLAVAAAAAQLSARQAPRPSAPLANEAPAWKEAAPGRGVSLPADHASHPDYRIEWWYYTGNLDAADGRRFGYQLTFFRIGVSPTPANRSRWAVRDLFMTHLAVTDVAGKRYRFAERMNRSGPGWAGAATDGYRVWNEDWTATRTGEGAHQLVAREGGLGVDLTLGEGRPAALHGDGGYSRKGSSAGNASIYYSLTRMPTRGSLTIDGTTVQVSGNSWMDHEFGTTFLEPEQMGWDWFSIQLDDGRDLMLFQLRRRDGSVDPRSSGTLVLAGGPTRALDGARDFQLTPGRTWASPASGARYPVSWDVRVPALGAELRVTAALPDQELRTAQSTGVTYWEGAVDVAGQVDGRPARGRGYLEMTGYAGPAMGTFLRQPRP